MNILLTGATGFVGKQLTIKLLEKGHTVYAIVRNQKKAMMLLSNIPSNFQKNLIVVDGDIILDKVGIPHEKISFLKGKIHTVYHIAAYLSFESNDKDKTFKVNLDGTRNILELAKEIGVTNLFHVSTAYTLGEMVNGKEELHPINNKFVNYYEESKCRAEHLVFQYNDFFNVSIFRPSIIIGDSRTGEAETTFALHGIIRSFELLTKRARRNKGLPQSFKFLCNKDIPQNFVPVDYVVNVLIAGLSYAEKNTIYHITNSNPPTNQSIFDLINEYLDLKNVEMVPTNYEGELTLEEQKFNEPLSVFYKYLERNINFDDTNTKQLLEVAKIKPLNLNKKMLMRIITGNINEDLELLTTK